ncbi:MAG: gamma-glutamyl-gamma-aminobutyrate hydrolase family protein [Marmoricola sp.]
MLWLPGHGSGPGWKVARTGTSEYGRTTVKVTSPGVLLADLPSEHKVWMSHGDAVRRAPDGFAVLASTDATEVAAFEDTERRFAGVQWHPEVMHTEHGQQVLEHFLVNIAGCRPTWTMVNIVEEQIERIREQIGDGTAICGLSVGSTPRLRPRWCSGRSVTGSNAFSSIMACCARARPSRSSRTSWLRPVSTSMWSMPSNASSMRSRGSPTLRRSARSSGASSSGSSRRPRPMCWVRLQLKAPRSPSWCRAPSIPTWSSQVAVRGSQYQVPSQCGRAA